MALGGPVDYGEPYLATWIPGQGRPQILDIGYAGRSMTGEHADELRAEAAKSGYDPEMQVRAWAQGRNGQPIRDPRLRCNQQRSRRRHSPRSTERRSHLLWRRGCG